MAEGITAGDRMSIVSRESGPADIKSMLYYPHYAGLWGEVAKVYADGTASINIDPDALPAEVRDRHVKGTEAMRLDWLDKLSNEARNKLSAAEKKFNLRYAVLVSTQDLAPLGDGPVKALGTVATPALPHRKSLAEIEADEAKHLEEHGAPTDER